jgi:short-subunit dehydrogenase
MPGFAKTNLFYSKDNAKDIIETKDKNIIDKFSMRVDKMANKIVKIIKRKKARAIVGLDAKLINFMYKLMPQTSGRIVGFVMRKTKMKTFETIYKKEK